MTIKFISDYHIADFLSNEEQDAFEGIIESLKINPSFKLTIDPEREDDLFFFYDEESVNVTEDLSLIADLINENGQDIGDFIETNFSDEDEFLLSDRVDMSFYGCNESTKECFDDLEIQHSAFESENIFQYIKNQVYFTRSMDIAREVSSIVRNVQKSEYNIIDWSIILYEIPEEKIYTERVYEVFNEDGKSLGHFSGYGEKFVVGKAYNWVNGIGASSGIDIKYTAKEIKVCGHKPNQLSPEEYRKEVLGIVAS